MDQRSNAGMGHALASMEEAPSAEILSEHVEILEQVAEGSFGVVYKVYCCMMLSKPVCSGSDKQSMDTQDRARDVCR